MPKVISVRITDEMETLINEAIKIKGVKARSEIIREALEIGLKKMVEEEKKREEVRNLLKDIVEQKKLLSLSRVRKIGRTELYRH